MEAQPKTILSSGKSASLVLFVGSLFYYLTFFNYGLEVDDEGYFLLGAAEVLRGKWPMADFTSYGPLSYWILAGFFKALGQGVMTERILLMILLLANGQAVLWIARRFLPLAWALAVAGLYAFAPGPWYKLFFISTLLLIAVVTLVYLDKPDWKRAFWLGLSVGFGFLCRKETGLIGLPVMLGIYALPFLRTWLDEKRLNLKALMHTACGLTGAVFPVAVAVAAYVHAGKWDLLVAYFQRFMFNPYTSGMLAKMGILTSFNPVRIISEGDIEQAFYGGGLLATAGFLLLALRDYFVRPMRRAKAMKRMVIGVMALASLAYSYPFVWGTRMLSTFPLVYLCYAAVVLMAVSRVHTTKLRFFWIGIGIVALVLPVLNFTKHQIYSGSITTRVAPTVAVGNPLLRGVYPYTANQRDIERLDEEMAKAPAGASMISMSESTTMGFLSGLSNPTIYRAFSLEFSRPGEEERAIETFEQKKITYFVGRRRQFFNEGGPASDLASYAPKIKDYLVAHYQIIPLGEHFVLLRRKNLPSS